MRTGRTRHGFGDAFIKRSAQIVNGNGIAPVRMDSVTEEHAKPVLFWVNPDAGTRCSG